MKKFFVGAMLLCVAMMFTGCGVMSQMTANANLTQTNVQLSTNNYRVIGPVVGSATDSYILCCIGGLPKNALTKNSYADMVKKAGLKDNQAIINVSTAENYKCYVVYGVREMVTSGVLIEFTE